MMSAVIEKNTDVKILAATKRAGSTTSQIIIYALVCGALLLVPSFVDDAYLLNKFSTYLVMGMLAVALSLSWGYAGILNLGQATSFGLGSYCMAMTLKLRTVPVHTGSAGLPDFMVWNNVESLPLIWQPFHSLTFAVIAGIMIPVIFSMLVGWFVFKICSYYNFSRASCCESINYRSTTNYRRLPWNNRSSTA